MKLKTTAEAHAAGYGTLEYSLSDASYTWLVPDRTTVRTDRSIPVELWFSPGMLLAKVADIRAHARQKAKA